MKSQQPADPPDTPVLSRCLVCKPGLPVLGTIWTRQSWHGFHLEADEDLRDAMLRGLVTHKEVVDAVREMHRGRPPFAASGVFLDLVGFETATVNLRFWLAGETGCHSSSAQLELLGSLLCSRERFKGIAWPFRRTLVDLLHDPIRLAFLGDTVAQDIETCDRLDRPPPPPPLMAAGGKAAEFAPLC